MKTSIHPTNVNVIKNTLFSYVFLNSDNLFLNLFCFNIKLI